MKHERLTTLHGFHIAEHGTRGDDYPTLILVDGKWYSTGDWDIPHESDIHGIVNEIRNGHRVVTFPEA